MRAIFIILAGVFVWGALLAGSPIVADADAGAERLVASSYGHNDMSAMKKEFRILWNDLNDFRRKKDFQRYGFTPKGPYGGWLRRVEDAGRRYPNNLQQRSGLVFGELRQAGLEYERNRGADSRRARDWAAQFNRALR